MLEIKEQKSEELGFHDDSAALVLIYRRETVSQSARQTTRQTDRQSEVSIVVLIFFFFLVRIKWTVYSDTLAAASEVLLKFSLLSGCNCSNY